MIRLRRGSYTQLAQSDRHLFAGTTVATVSGLDSEIYFENGETVVMLS